MATTDSLPVPKKNADFRLRVFIEDASGDPASSFTNANSTISQDDTSFVDCTNEVAFVGNGYGYIDLTSSEMNCDGLVYRFECGEGSFQVEICPEEAGDIRVNATQLGGTNYATAVTALVASFWNALTSGITTSGSIGKLIVDNLNAAVGTVSTNVSTLLTRLTSTRAGYLDKLNITGNVASQNSLDNVHSNIGTVQTQLANIGTKVDSIEASTYGIKGDGFDTSTDSLEALRNRGDAAWVTATGFATSAALTTVEGKIDTVDGVADSIKVDTGTTIPALIPNLYAAQIEYTVDGANTRDEYTATWFKNGVRQTSGITSPTIQVAKRADGTDLIASTAMSAIGSTGSLKYDTTTEGARLTAGESAIVIVTATIDGNSRTWSRLVSRDSAAAE